MKNTVEPEQQVVEPDKATQQRHSQGNPGVDAQAAASSQCVPAKEAQRSTLTETEIEERARGCVEYLHEINVVCPPTGVHDKLLWPTIKLLENDVPSEVVYRAVRLWIGDNGTERRADDWGYEIKEAIRSAQARLKLPPDERAKLSRLPKRPPVEIETIRSIRAQEPMTLAELEAANPFKLLRTPRDIACRRALRELFPNENALICLGKTTLKKEPNQQTGRFDTTKVSWTKPLKEQLKSAHLAEYIVPTPAGRAEGVTRAGRPSKRSKDMFEGRRRQYIVIECDPPPADKNPELHALLDWDGQANVLHHLGRCLPLVMVVHSAGKSLHGWYRADELTDEQIEDFYHYAATLGADMAALQPHQLVRMPFGERFEEVDQETGQIVKGGGTQRVVYFEPRRAIGRPVMATEHDEMLLTNVVHWDGLKQIQNPRASRTDGEVVSDEELVTWAAEPEDREATVEVEPNDAVSHMEGQVSSLKNGPEAVYSGSEPAPETNPSTNATAEDMGQLATTSAKAGEKPFCRLPGENRPLSMFASQLGLQIGQPGFCFNLGGVVVVPAKDFKFKTLTPEIFRTFAEKHVRTGVQRADGDGNVREVPKSMTREDAAAVLNSQQFLDKLKHVRSFMPVRAPVLREDGTINLLPPGYDNDSQVFTALNGPEIQELSLESAVTKLRGMLSEFEFVDPIGLARTIGGMLTVYAKGILPKGALRPAFVFTANNVGAGKTLLAKLLVTPTFGFTPIATKAQSDEEARKMITSSVLTGRPVLVLDNLKGHLDLPSIEALLTSRVWEDRLLGGNQKFTGEHDLTLVISGNRLTCSPDFERRAMWVELLNPYADVSQREFKVYLEESTFQERRAEILGCLWTLVREWDLAGRPKATRSHSSFPVWANVIGGIVEHAGFGCLIGGTRSGGDRDLDDFRSMIQKVFVEAKVSRIPFEDLAMLILQEGLFEWVFEKSSDWNVINASVRSRLGKLLKRYDKQMLGDWRFLIEGSGRDRVYSVSPVKPGLPELPDFRPQESGSQTPELPLR